MYARSLLSLGMIGLCSASVALGQPPADSPSQAHRFVTHLSGQNEVPPRDTTAQGQFLAVLSPDGTILTYRLIAANISNAVASHIHLGPTGQNGPPVVFLFGPAPAGGGALNGVLAEGTITAADLFGALAGQDLSVLVAALASGGAYVNVHTNDGGGGVDTGPGDFASGEVRGQIRPIGR